MKKIYNGTKQERSRQSAHKYRRLNLERSRKQWVDYRHRKLVASAGRLKPKVCDVCGGNGKICFDHNHAKGEFRGWICNHCNLILGHAKDNAELLEKMIQYLRGNGAIKPTFHQISMRLSVQSQKEQK